MFGIGLRGPAGLGKVEEEVARASHKVVEGDVGVLESTLLSKVLVEVAEGSDDELVMGGGWVRLHGGAVEREVDAGQLDGVSALLELHPEVERVVLLREKTWINSVHIGIQ